MNLKILSLFSVFFFLFVNVLSAISPSVSSSVAVESEEFWGKTAKIFSEPKLTLKGFTLQIDVLGSHAENREIKFARNTA